MPLVQWGANPDHLQLRTCGEPPRWMPDDEFRYHELEPWMLLSMALAGIGPCLMLQSHLGASDGGGHLTR